MGCGIIIVCYLGFVRIPRPRRVEDFSPWVLLDGP